MSEQTTRAPDMEEAPDTCSTRYRAMMNRLYSEFPRAFFSNYKKVRPLAVGTREEAAARLGITEQRDMTALLGAMAAYTHSMGYLSSIVRGGPRVTLDGLDSDPVTGKQKAAARTAIWKRKKDAAALAKRRAIAEARQRAIAKRKRRQAAGTTGQPVGQTQRHKPRQQYGERVLTPTGQAQPRWARPAPEASKATPTVTVRKRRMDTLPHGTHDKEQ